MTYKCKKLIITAIIIKGHIESNRVVEPVEIMLIAALELKDGSYSIEIKNVGHGPP
jgi:hypothetical protein